MWDSSVFLAVVDMLHSGNCFLGINHNKVDIKLISHEAVLLRSDCFFCLSQSSSPILRLKKLSSNDNYIGLAYSMEMEETCLGLYRLTCKGTVAFGWKASRLLVGWIVIARLVVSLRQLDATMQQLEQTVDQ